MTLHRLMEQAQGPSSRSDRVALGCTDQLQPHLLWAVSGVEHVSLITGRVEDCTPSTVFTHRFES
jgi:hypothetical protein